MKKFLCFLIAIFCITLSQSGKVFADDENFYAKVQTKNVAFYSRPDENSALFELPYSYFVKVDSVVGSFYKATYKDIVGFVKKDQVTLMKGQPQTPYFQGTFENYLAFSLYESPTKSSKSLANLTENTTLNYYGTKSGQLLSAKTSNWIYCSTYQNDKTIYGYVYYEIANILPNIQTNLESFEVVDESKLTQITPVEFSKLSTGTKVLLIVSISVPSVLILYFLIKPGKITQITKTRKKAKAESKKIRHGDYFEFDESQL